MLLIVACALHPHPSAPKSLPRPQAMTVAPFGSGKALAFASMPAAQAPVMGRSPQQSHVADALAWGV